MKIALLGYGKMGKIIEEIALSRGHEISAKITSKNLGELNTFRADVAIEFSKPEAAFQNISSCLERGIPVACGTTGWLDRKAEIENLTQLQDGTFFYASNFSVGVNLFFKLNEYLANLTKSLSQFEVCVDEIHHTEKKDTPSGTAITLAQGIMKYHTDKKKWVNQATDNPAELPIHSFRIDQVPGTHTVKYESMIDTIEMRHVAHSREGFAKGAVLVAEWIKDKKGILTMDDFMKF